MSVGWNLKRLRTEQGRTLEDVARASGCSRSMLSKVENDHAVPSMASLVAIARALGVEPASMVCGDPAGGAVFEPAGHARPVVAHPSGHRLEAIAAALPGRKMHAWLVSADRAASQPTAQAHAGELLVLVLEGEVLWRVGLVEYRMAAGATLQFDARHEHGVTLVSERARWLAVACG